MRLIGFGNAGLGAAVLAGAMSVCVGLTGPAAASLDSCVAAIRSQAVKAGVSRSTVEAALQGVAYDEKAVRFSTSQPEYKTPIWDYLAFLVDDARIEDGRAMLKRHATTLANVEKRYGVDRHIVAAVWGVESDYGQFRGDFHVPHALANVACAGRRAKYFRSELIEILKIVDRKDVRLSDLQGSWAGAFRADPVHAVHLSASRRRFRRRRTQGSRQLGTRCACVHRQLPQEGRLGHRHALGLRGEAAQGLQRPRRGRKTRASVTTWGKRGIRHLDGGDLTGAADAGLLLPAGAEGPAFLVFKNFNAIYSYNVAESYALAISHLADRLRGGGAFKVGWPTADPGLSRAERLELQKLLLRAGYDIGEADGRVGAATREGIRQAEARFGFPRTGRPGQRIYKALGGR